MPAIRTRVLLLLIAATFASCGGVQGRIEVFVQDQVDRAALLSAACATDGGPSELAAISPGGDKSASLITLLRATEVQEYARSLETTIASTEARIAGFVALIARLAEDAPSRTSALELIATPERIVPGHPLVASLAAALTATEIDVAIHLQAILELGRPTVDARVEVAGVAATTAPAANRGERFAVVLTTLADSMTTWKLGVTTARSLQASALALANGLSAGALAIADTVAVDCSAEVAIGKSGQGMQWIAAAGASAVTCLTGVATALRAAFDVGVPATSVTLEATPLGFVTEVEAGLEVSATASIRIDALLEAVRGPLEASRVTFAHLRATSPRLSVLFERAGARERDLLSIIRALDDQVTTLVDLGRAVAAHDGKTVLKTLRTLLVDQQINAHVDMLLLWVVRGIGFVERRVNLFGQGNLFLSIAKEAASLAGIDRFIARKFAGALVTALDRMKVPRAVVVTRTCSLYGTAGPEAGNLVSLFLEELITEPDPPGEEGAELRAAVSYGISRAQLHVAEHEAGVHLSRNEEDAVLAEIGFRILPMIDDAAIELAPLRAELTAHILVDLAAGGGSDALQRLASLQEQLLARTVTDQLALAAHMRGAADRDSLVLERLAAAIEHTDRRVRDVVDEQDRLDALIAWCLQQADRGARPGDWSCTPEEHGGATTATIRYRLGKMVECGYALDDHRAAITDFATSVASYLGDNPGRLVTVQGFASHDSPLACQAIAARASKRKSSQRKGRKGKQLTAAERTQWLDWCSATKVLVDGAERTLACDDPLTAEERGALELALNLRLADTRAANAYRILLAALDPALHRNVALLQGAIAGDKKDQLSQSVMFVLR